MSSGVQEPGGEPDGTPEGESGGAEGDGEGAEGALVPGAVAEVVCTGCKQRRTQRVLLRAVSRSEMVEGAGFEDACAACQGAEPHTVLEVHQEIRVPLGSMRTVVSLY